MTDDYYATVTLHGRQLRLVAQALELFVGLGLGRYGDLVDHATWTHGSMPDGSVPRPMTPTDRDAFRDALRRFQPVPNGNVGIGNGAPLVKSAYQVKKALERADYEARGLNKDPDTRRMNLGDGVTVKYAPDDPIPLIEVTRGPDRWAVNADRSH